MVCVGWREAVWAECEGVWAECEGVWPECEGVRVCDGVCGVDEAMWAVWGTWHRQLMRASHFLLPHPKFPSFRSGHWGIFFRTFAPPPRLNPLPSRIFTPRPAGH